MAITAEQYGFIVGELARHTTPVEIVKEFGRRFKPATCDLVIVTACERRNLTPDWQAEFDRLREEYLAAPIGDKQFRIAELHKHYVVARDRGAVSEALKILEQAAKDAAGFFDGKAPAKADAPADGEVTAITRTIVDPVPHASE